MNLKRAERLKLDILSLKAFGVSTRWQKLYTRGVLGHSGYKLGPGKGGWRAGNQKTLVRVWSPQYYSIGTIRRIMLNRIKMRDWYTSLEKAKEVQALSKVLDETD
jgi:hypothetical protein